MLGVWASERSEPLEIEPSDAESRRGESPSFAFKMGLLCLPCRMRPDVSRSAALQGLIMLHSAQ